MKPCDFCGSDFTPKRRDMRFCRHGCYAQAHAERARNARRAKPAAVKPCVACGKPFRLKRSDSQFCSYDCWNRVRNERRKNPAIPKVKHCGQCGAEFQTALTFQDYCSDACRRRARTERTPKKGLHTGPRVRNVEATCRVCGNRFSCTRRDARFCSVLCSTRDENRRVDAHALRARRRGAFVARVFKLDIYVRDDWTCRLCGEPVPREARWPQPMSASLDHIVPLSKGGTHEPANVQLAHLRCNLRKGNRVALVA